MRPVGLTWCMSLCVYVTDTENNVRINWSATSGNPKFLQNSAEFCRNPQNGAVHATSQTQTTCIYVIFHCHEHGIHTISALINRWNMPLSMMPQANP